MSVWQAHGPTGPIGPPERTLEEAKRRAVRRALADQRRELEPDQMEALWSSLLRAGWHIQMVAGP